MCRSRALGGRLYRCDDCRGEVNIYNSCGDRHCPQCSGARRRDWLDRAAAVILPGIHYFQVVFTLPDKLSGLALGNRREIYSLLMRSAWQALNEILREEFGIRAAATLVLHTWNQRLEHHPHVHALVPGGGLSFKGDRWINTHHKKHRRRKQPYLVDILELGKRFREAFVQGLQRIHRTGELKLDGRWSEMREAATLESWLETVAPDGWNVFIERPPTQNAKPENVLKYLARYMSGGPISDRRLISHDEQSVYFWARSLEKPPPGKRPTQVAEQLPVVEFTRRWSLHILPSGFVKVRSYGGFSNKHRADYLQRCCQLLDIQPTEQRETDTETEQPDETELSLVEIKLPELACPHCGKSMRCVSTSERPSWSVTMNSLHRPPWYQRF